MSTVKLPSPKGRPQGEFQVLHPARGLEPGKTRESRNLEGCYSRLDQNCWLAWKPASPLGLNGLAVGGLPQTGAD